MEFALLGVLGPNTALEVRSLRGYERRFGLAVRWMDVPG